MNSVDRSYQPLDILLVEDDPDHTELISIALHKANELNHIVICNSGPEAIHFLTRKAPDDYSIQPLPSLILLDLRMPGMDGLEVIKTLKGDEKLSTIPICVLTTSEDPDDISRCYADGANGYVSKPTNFNELSNRILEISRFWIDVNTPPKGFIATRQNNDT